MVREGGRYETQLDDRHFGGSRGGPGWMDGPGERSSGAAGPASHRRASRQGAVQSGNQRRFRAAYFQAYRRSRAGTVGTGIQEYPGRFPQEGSSRAIAPDHEPGIQPSFGSELQTLSCGGRLLEGRQASQALRSRYGADALLDQPAAREDAKLGDESQRALH